jgi:hypothetical protein
MPASSSKPATSPVDRRRRRHPRYRADFRVTVSYLLGNKHQKIEGHCRDLSQAGIGIFPGSLVAGSAVPWEVRAVVRYRRGYQYGFEFLALTAEQRTLLDNYLIGKEQVD